MHRFALALLLLVLALALPSSAIDPNQVYYEPLLEHYLMVR